MFLTGRSDGRKKNFFQSNEWGKLGGKGSKRSGPKVKWGLCPNSKEGLCVNYVSVEGLCIKYVVVVMNSTFFAIRGGVPPNFFIFLSFSKVGE